MAQNETFDPVALQGYYPAGGILADNDIINIRFTSGQWGIGDRWLQVRLRLVDPNTGQPLAQPEYEDTGLPAENRGIVVAVSHNAARNIFNNVQPAGGPNRHGPLHDGQFQVGDDPSEHFVPIEENLIPQEIVNLGAARREVRLLREMCVRLLHVRRQMMGMGMPGAIQPQPPVGPLPAPAQPPIPGPPVPPPVPPPAPPAPVNPPVPPVQPIHHLPITHIRAVIGETPAQIRDVPLWLAQSIPALTGVYPAMDAGTLTRLVNAITARHPGLALGMNEAGSWHEAVHLIWQRTFGATALHALSDVLKGIAQRNGVVMALEMGLMFTNDDWDLTWSVIRRCLPGQASVVTIQARLDALPNNQARIIQAGFIIREVYEVLGLDPLGRPLNFPGGLTQRDTAVPVTRGRGRGRTGPRRGPVLPVSSNQRRQETAGGNQPQTQPQQQNTFSNQTNQRGNQRQWQNRGTDSQRRYFFRPRPSQPQRYGSNQGPDNPNPYRGRDSTNQSGQERQLPQQQQGSRRGPGRNTNSGNNTVHTVRQVESSQLQQNASPTASPSTNQGQQP
ncbi:Gag [Equine foamy virus]|uniref:Gag polyprotein n=1 Tax=equine foamy virus Equus caballus TaxID=2849477 RepID=Q9J4C8_9RETR|nr:Gag [Equine foamy virus]AAF64413.1 Gag [equine foamy virus Equus caballus]